MKKIYERPVVELTKFDVEDIMSVSGGTTMDLSKADSIDAATKTAIESGVKNGGSATVGVYNW